jgi:hypothetical protein
MALALARWTAEVLKPEAEATVARSLERVAIGTSYECRSQNHRAGAKLSEHAFANGADVAGFTFTGGRSVMAAFLDGASPDGRFLQAARSAACRYFSTVLGPGSDPAHANHLHLDLRARKRGYRICQ